MISSCNQEVAQRLTLRFLDTKVHLRSDDAAHLERFARFYRRFVVGSTASSGNDIFSSTEGKTSSAEYAIWTQSNNPWGQPVVALNGEVYPLHDAKVLAPFVYQDIVCDLLSRVRSHILIHAGVVARKGRGILLVADSFHGKTTLVLSLVRRGFAFLSDETAALGRQDGLVHPFPRSLSVRAGTLERIGCADLLAGAPAYAGKHVLDIDQVRAGCLGQAVPVGHVLFLCDPEQNPQERVERELWVLFDRLDDDTLAEIERIDGLGEVRVQALHGYPLLCLYAARRTHVYSQIEVLCRARGIWILDVITGPTGAPSFEAHARLEALPGSQAVLELLQRYQGGYRSAVMDELGGNSARLYLELAAILVEAACHRLYVGPLEEMVELVCGLA